MRFVWTILVAALVPAVRGGEPGPQLKLLGRLEGAHPVGYSRIALSPNGKVLASSDQADDNDVPVVKLWDVATRKEITALEGSADPNGDGFSVAFSPDGKTLAVVGAKLRVFELASGQERASFKGSFPVAFSPDGKTLAAATADQTVTLWDLSTGKEKVSFKVCQGRWGLFSLAFSPDGKSIATGSGLSGSEGLPSDGELKLWDADTGKEKASLTGRVKLHVPLTSLSSLKAEGVPKRVLLKLTALNGKVFATEEEAEKEMLLLAKDQPTKVQELVRQYVSPVREVPTVWIWSVAFSPDGKTLASGDVFGNVLLWDVQSGKRTTTLQRFNPKGREGDINPAYSVVFSPDGTTLAAGTLRGISLWDVESGDKVASSRPAATVWSVAFSSDGKTVASAGSTGVIGPRDPREGDPTLRLWEWIPSKKADR